MTIWMEKWTGEGGGGLEKVGQEELMQGLKGLNQSSGPGDPL